MPAPKIKADYESLRTIAFLFGREANATLETVRSLSQSVSGLESGDFYRAVVHHPVLEAVVNKIGTKHSDSQRGQEETRHQPKAKPEGGSDEGKTHGGSRGVGDVTGEEPGRFVNESTRPARTSKKAA